MRRSITMVSWLALGVSLVAGLASCDAKGDRTRAEATTAEGAVGAGTESSPGSEYHYSSFGIRIDARNFGLISFKDVGLDRSEPDPSGRMLEAVAQSLAYELQVRDDLAVQPRVVHDTALADPEEHTYCEEDRLYVDLWRSESPSRWGYSLWSGCSASMKFASDEVRIDQPPEKVEIEESVEPLTTSIAKSFADAVEHGCYRRTC